jgi:hypothetical protein
MSIIESTAVIRAIDAVKRVLSAKLPTRLAEMETAEVGLNVPPPDAYRIALSRDAVSEVLTNAFVSCFVFQSRSSEVVSESSGTPTYIGGVQLTYIEIRIMYQHAPQDTYTPDEWEQSLTTSDILARRGYYYAAAVNEVMRRDLCCGSGGVITDVVSKESDYAGETYDSDSAGSYGMATLIYGVRLDTQIPHCED